MSQSASRVNVSPVVISLDNTSTYPYTIGGNALNVVNTGVATLVITLKNNNSADQVINIPNGFSWSDNVISFYEITATGSASFIIDIKRATK